MELCGEPGVGLVAHAFVGAVVHVDEIRFPVGGQGAAVHSVAMVLGSDEAAVGADHAHRLVVAAVAVLELVDRGAGSFGKELVSHADAHAGAHLGTGEELADVFHSLDAGVGVSGAVGQEEAVEFQVVEVVVPGHADDFHTATEQAADDVVLHAAVHEHDFLEALAFVVTHDFLTRNARHVVHAFVLRRGHVVGLIVEEDFSHHHPMLAQHLGEFAGVYSRDAGHFLAFQPVAQTLGGVPVAVLFAVVAHDDG